MLLILGNMRLDFSNSLHHFIIIIAAFAVSTMLSSCGGEALTPPTTHSSSGQAKLAWDPPDILTDVTGFMIPDYAIGVSVASFMGRENRDVLSQSPRNHSLLFMASDSFKIR